MAFRGNEIPVFDLSGGQASNRHSTGLEFNQALEVDNVHSLPGNGFEMRQGDTEVNSTAFNSGAAWQGLAWFKLSNGDTDLVGVNGNKIGKTDYVSGSPDGTIDDVTSGLTITAGQDNLWFGFTAKDDLYFWGGPETTFDTPFKFDGTTATVVSGSAPSGKFAFFHNNRLFVLTDTEIKHGALIDLTDFSGEFSGAAEIDANDGFKLMSAAPLNTDIVLLFKENSIHQYVTSSFPFPRFPLFRDVGAVGPGAVVIDEGIAYFITPEARMKATDGRQIIDFPSDIDDVWDGLNRDRLKFLRGFVYQAENHKHIGWLVSFGSTQSTHNLVILWDLEKKSWWRYSTGYKMNAVTHDVTNNRIYGGHYDGKIYEKDVDDKFTDDSESEGVTYDDINSIYGTSTYATGSGIVAFWEWGWQTLNSFQKIIHPQRVQTSLQSTKAVDIVNLTYAFDFSLGGTIKEISSQGKGPVYDATTSLYGTSQYGDTSDVIRTTFIFGRGNAFKIKYANKTPGTFFRVNGFTVSGKQESQKVFQAK